MIGLLVVLLGVGLVAHVRRGWVLSQSIAPEPAPALDIECPVRDGHTDEPFDWFGRGPNLRLVHSTDVPEENLAYWERILREVNDPEGFDKHLGQ